MELTKWCVVCQEFYTVEIETPPGHEISGNLYEDVAAPIPHQHVSGHTFAPIVDTSVAEREALRLDALRQIDAAAVALDERITTVGGQQALEYAYRAQQIERWDADPVQDIDEVSAPPPCTILGQTAQAPPRYRWGLLRCYWQGMQLEYPGATVTDAINKIRLERDTWLYILDERAKGRLSEIGKPAVRIAATEAEIIAARDAAIAFLNGVGT